MVVSYIQDATTATRKKEKDRKKGERKDCPRRKVCVEL
jgi:hypothetical protein